MCILNIILQKRFQKVEHEAALLSQLLPPCLKASPGLSVWMSSSRTSQLNSCVSVSTPVGGEAWNSAPQLSSTGLGSVRVHTDHPSSPAPWVLRVLRLHISVLRSILDQILPACFSCFVYTLNTRFSVIFGSYPLTKGLHIFKNSFN